jgi:hypothetical protein
VASRSRLLSDDPVDGSAEAPDLLDRREYVDHVVELLDQVRAQGPSSVLSLIADWGAGKSSIVNMLKRCLISDEPGREKWLIAEFNPWIHSDLESLIYGFFAELREALPKEDKWNNTRERIGAFAKQAAPLGKLGSLLGLDLSGMAEAAAKLITGDTSMSAVRTRVEESLRQLDRPILMILDDFDRLAPEELLLVFKLVRLLGRLPNVYYLLCYDERTLLDILSRTALVGSNEGRARDYMEKRDALVNSAIDTIVQHYQIQLRPDDGNRFYQAYQCHLKSRLMTPRAVNRFFGQADGFYDALLGEVDFVDYLLMTFLRTAEPGVYKLLQQRKLQLIASVSTNPLTRRSPDAPDLEAWQNDLSDAGVNSNYIQGIIEVLAVLFAPIKALRDSSTASQATLDDIGQRRGVGHADYFDRYFAFSVPTEDIADSTVSAAMAELAANRPAEAEQELSGALVSDTEKVVRKISALAAVQVLPTAALARLLAGKFDQVPGGNIFTSRPDLSVARLTCDLIAGIADSDTGTALLTDMATTDGGLRLVLHVMHLFEDVKAESVGIASPSWIAHARETVKTLIKERLTQATAEPLGDLPNRLFKELVWGWHNLDAEGVAAWLREQVSNGTWSLSEVLAKYVTFTEDDAGQMLPQPMLGDLNIAEVNALFDLQYVLEQLRPQIDSATEVNRFAPVTTPGQAEQYVFSVLKDVRGRIARPASPPVDPSEPPPADPTESTAADD